MYRTLCGRSDEGAALMIALGILAILAMLGGAFVVFMRIEQSRAEYEVDTLGARYIARGGIEVARVRVETLDAPTGEITGNLPGGTYSVNIREVTGAYEADATGKLTRTDGSVVTSRISARMRPAEGGVRIETWHE